MSGWAAAWPGIALAALLTCGPARAQDEPSGPAWIDLPFAQKLDMRVVREVVDSAPERLLAAMARVGVELRLVRSAAPAQPPNPLLAGLPAATAELLRQAEFRDSYEGRVVLRGDACCGLDRDTILIRDTASTYTLLHEFVQSRLEPTDGSPVVDDTELRFAVDFRRLQLYQRRLADDPRRLLDPRWRRDILGAQAAVAERLFRRIQMGQSQEAIVEKLLCCLIDERSPYRDEARRAQGLGYGAAMIDNAIDLFNAVHESVAFVRETVAGLRDEVGSGRLQPASGQGLTEGDAQAVDAACRRVGLALDRVRDEVARLRRFYEG